MKKWSIVLIIVFVLIGCLIIGVYFLSRSTGIKYSLAHSKKSVLVSEISPQDKKEDKAILDRKVDRAEGDEKLAKKIQDYLNELRETCLRVDSIEGVMFSSEKTLRELQRIGEAAVPYLVESAYDRNNDWKIRFVLIGLLPSIEDAAKREDVVNLFLDLAKDANEIEDVRINAVRGLRWIKAEDSFALLDSILKNDKEPTGLKVNILTTLSVLDEKRSIPILIDSLNDETDWQIQLSAISSLDRLRSKEALPVIINKLGQQQKTSPNQAEEDQKEIVTMHMVSALGNIGAGEAKVEKTLITILNNKYENIDSRIAAAESLGNLKSKKAIDILWAMLEDEDGLMRIKASEALLKIENRNAVDKLKDYVQNENDAFVKARIEKFIQHSEGNIDR